jgi:hypothetical protein
MYNKFWMKKSQNMLAFACQNGFGPAFLYRLLAKGTVQSTTCC